MATEEQQPSQDGLADHQSLQNHNEVHKVRAGVVKGTKGLSAPLYSVGGKVAISERVGNRLKKKEYWVANVRTTSTGGFEYQLKDGVSGQLHMNGKWWSQRDVNLS